MANINGTGRADRLNGTAAADLIDGLAGDDTIFGNGGADRLIGGSGEDLLIGGAGNDTLDASDRPSDVDVSDEVRYADATAGVDVDLRAGVAIGNASVGRDTLIDVETVSGSRFADVLRGGSVANDDFESFIGLRGADTINGGSGFDEVRYDRDGGFGGNAGIVARLAAGTIRDGFGTVDKVSFVEAVRGTLVRDLITGDAEDNRFRGLGGNDALNGGAGFDFADYLRDAAYAGGGGAINANLATGRIVDGFGDTDIVTSIERVRGTIENDTIVGNAVANNLNGDDGNDTLSGGGGSDSLFGSDGLDSLTGGDGGDYLRAGFGGDRIVTGGGFDIVRLEFGDRAVDVVTDFARADVVQLFGDDFRFAEGKALVRGENYIVGPQPQAVDDVPTLLFNTRTGTLSYDANGTDRGGVDVLARFTNLPAAPDIDIV